MKVILTHPNADFDAIASLLGAHKLDPHSTPLLPRRLNRNVREFLALYQRGLPFMTKNEIRGEKITQITLVDTQRLPDIKGIPHHAPLRIIDHHPRMDGVPDNDDIVIDEVGSAATLFVERMQTRGLTLNSLEATLLALGVYEDTGALTYGTTTPRDIRAAAWLLEQKAVLDTVRRFLTPPLTEEQRLLADELVKNAQSRIIQGYTVTVCTAAVDKNINQVNSVAHRLRDMLDPAALFVAVQMPGYIQLVCRAAEDAIDVGEIAKLFGGGGHGRAAAAAIEDKTLEEVERIIWQELEAHVRPVKRVADLMSYGVQTVQADHKLLDVISRLRRVGHEGYPVLDRERVVGLLALRDADRAIEHGMKNATIRDVMKGGEITITPDDSVAALELLIVESGWGQIPVMSAGKLIGIVTRTDLIKHWAKVHPAAAPLETLIDFQQMEAVLGRPVALLIEAIGNHAQQNGISSYMVGGVVRDLLLERSNFDIDFVIEGSAISFAKSLGKEFGGEVTAHQAFGTAKWVFNDKVAEKLRITLDALPHHIDFASSRYEFYEHPTALPTVYAGSIKLDLYRRDFTLNTLAVQLSPETHAGRVLDFYGGLADLRNGVIRVLHSLSFVDDPTRVLRAVRFSQRLGFTIEPRTAELITTSRDMLRRITGERIRNELTLILREKTPEDGLMDLKQRGVLEAIHPAFRPDDQFPARFEAARAFDMSWLPNKPNLIDLYYHLLVCFIPIAEIQPLGERLLINHHDISSMVTAAKLVQSPGSLDDEQVKPSYIDTYLNGIPDVALAAAWITYQDDLIRERIRRYVTEWRGVRPVTDGHALRTLGLTPGPRYKIILDRLRMARLDNEVTTDEQERELLGTLLQEE